MNTRTSQRRGGWLFSFAGIAVLAALVVAIAAPAATTADAQATCGICGKNLIKNPGADAGLGITAVDARGAVPGWTIEAGQFGAASYTFPNGWFSARSKGPAKRGKNYFFGGTTKEAVEAPASVGKQTIALPRAAVGRKANLSGWLGNYGENRTQVRAEFVDASGAVLSTVRIGPAVTIAGTDMGFRTRNGKVPGKTTQVTISVIFSGGGANYKLAGADSLSLVLS
ncbi:MAG TPA: hypothetical protein VJ807_05785 [Gaiellaceae bacterium]|nr:hypothetical protein [Gaiellaceae bacterium]